MLKEFSSTAMFVRNTNQVDAELDGETVILNIKEGQYYGLDEIGSRVWGLLEQPRTIGELVNAITQEYDVSKECCERDLILFLTRMIDLGLICDNKHTNC